MKTGSVMGNKSSSELLLSFLLIAALCLNALTIERTAYCPAEKMNWTEARQYCQKYHIDLVTWSNTDKSQLAWLLGSIKVKQAWIGLHRDPEKDSVWKWINLKSGEGLTGDNLSQSSDWGHGQQSSHCALVNMDSKWCSERCSQAHEFYCSEGDHIKHHNETLDWYSASQNCKDDNSNELATITKANTDQLQKVGWIGLYREGGDTWNWIGDQPSDYRNWAEGEPLNADCGSFQTDTKTWNSTVCSEEHRFVCYGDNLVVVNKMKTWENALTYCRRMETPCEDPTGPCMYHYDLLSLDLLSDYSYVRDRISRATTDEVWMGLRFLGGEWWWMNGQMLKNQQMLPDCPSQRKHCGTLSKHDTNNWIIRECSEQRNFICSRQKMFIEHKQTDQEKNIKSRQIN